MMDKVQITLTDVEPQVFDAATLLNMRVDEFVRESAESAAKQVLDEIRGRA